MGLFIGSSLVSPVELESSVEVDNVTINENSSDKLQSIGIVNDNIEDIINSPIQFWQGTYQQWTDGEVKTYHNWKKGGIDITNTNISFVPKSIVYANGKYIAVGTGGAIYSSTDKSTWTQETSGVNVDLNGIAYGNNKFIAVGNSGTILSSSGDGTWTIETSGVSNNITSITFGNNLFVTGGKGLYSSGDGTWTANNYDYSPVVFANGYFLSMYLSARWGSAQGTLYRSSDAINWTSNQFFLVMDNNGTVGNYSITSIGNIAYRHYEYAEDGDPHQGTQYSTDGGATWNNFSVTYYSQQIPKSGCYDGTTYYALFGSNLLTASDGINYTSIGSASGISYLIYGDIVLGVGGSSTLNVMTYDPILIAYTLDENPTTSSQVYSTPDVASALTITSVGTGNITLSDNNTYNYNSSGNQVVKKSIGQLHPDWVCIVGTGYASIRIGV